MTAPPRPGSPPAPGCLLHTGLRWGGLLRTPIAQGPVLTGDRGAEILEQDGGLPGPKSVRLDCWPGVRNRSRPLPLPILAGGWGARLFSGQSDWEKGSYQQGQLPGQARVCLT